MEQGYQFLIQYYFLFYEGPSTWNTKYNDACQIFKILTLENLEKEIVKLNRKFLLSKKTLRMTSQMDGFRY